MAPRLAAFQDRIYQNEPLFKRVETVYRSPDKAKLTPEQQRLCWLHYTGFVRSGARLDAASKQRLSEINQRLAELFTNFSQNVLAEETEYVTFIERPSDLAGLPDPVVSAAAAPISARRWPTLTALSPSPT
jgi:peptidyl-dipeptidase Dcp